MASIAPSYVPAAVLVPVGVTRRLLILVAATAALLAGCAGATPGDARPAGDGTSGSTTTTSASEAAPGRPEISLGAISEQAVQTVAPADEAPFAGVRRDCGFSTGFDDGSALWVYCDTVLFDDDDRIRFFTNTSSAVATADEPLVMLDAADETGEPPTFITPASDYPACDPGQGRFTWPNNAVEIRDGDELRIVYFYENVCVVPGGFVGYDAGVAELRLDAATAPPAGTPIEAEIVTPRLFERDEFSPPFGQAAVLHEGRIHVYRCPDSPTPCRVARVDPDLVGDLAAYEYWTGDDWSPNPDDASPMDMPFPFTGIKPSVQWVDDLGVFVMVDHHRGKQSRLVIRAAYRPEGPWSEPAIVELPGCSNAYPQTCLAGEVHPQLSSPDRLGVTWYDAAYPAGTRFLEIPIEVTGAKRPGGEAAESGNTGPSAAKPPNL